MTRNACRREDCSNCTPKVSEYVLHHIYSLRACFWLVSVVTCVNAYMSCLEGTPDSIPPHSILFSNSCSRQHKSLLCVCVLHWQSFAVQVTDGNHCFHLGKKISKRSPCIVFACRKRLLSFSTLSTQSHASQNPLRDILCWDR
jgi:hypothetical protein